MSPVIQLKTQKAAIGVQVQKIPRDLTKHGRLSIIATYQRGGKVISVLFSAMINLLPVIFVSAERVRLVVSSEILFSEHLTNAADMS